MTIDTSVVGRSYPSAAPYDISRSKIAEFAAAIGDDNPVYRDVDVARALEHPDVIAPPTFATVLTIESWRAVMADLGIDFSNVLHVDQRFVVDRALRAGDVVTAETVIEAVTERMGASWLTLRTDITAPDGEHLCAAVATIMVRGADA